MSILQRHIMVLNPLQLLSRPTRSTLRIWAKLPPSSHRHYQTLPRANQMMPPRIAIVGGGPAGLTLGLLLHKHRIPFTIFELRDKPGKGELEQPSGMLDLHEDTGLAVIRECGLYDEFAPLTGECTEDFRIADKSGKILLANQGGNSRPEISRNNLSKLLYARLPAESIRWGQRLVSATRTTAPGNKHYETRLDFGPLGTHTFDLVVGADGAWSRVRRLLTDLEPVYTKSHNITLTVQHMTTKHPHLSELIGTGSFTCLGMRNAVVSQRGPNDSARIYLWFTVPDEEFRTASGFAGKPASSAKDRLLRDEALYGTFGPQIKELISVACDEETKSNPGGTLDIRGLYKIPHGSTYEHCPGATLVGDAAHLMLPNGEGVNFAMFDSLLLSQAIVKAYNTTTTNGEDVDAFQSTLDPLLQDFESGMVERAKKMGEETDLMMSKMFGSDDAAHDFVGFFEELTGANS